MKKVKELSTYYCDYCGKECKHTDITLPSLEYEAEYVMNDGVKLAEFSREILEIKQKDVCPECQKEIAKFLRLMTYTTVKINDVEKAVFENFNKVVSSCKMTPTICGSKESIDILNDLTKKFSK